jgi:hypothetical protein
LRAASSASFPLDGVRLMGLSAPELAWCGGDDGEAVGLRWVVGLPERGDARADDTGEVLVRAAVGLVLG